MRECSYSPLFAQAGAKVWVQVQHQLVMGIRHCHTWGIQSAKSCVVLSGAFVRL